MIEPILQYDHVTITYLNGHCAVRDVSLTIAPGECLALVGESGCGKTTLARAALGLLPAGTKVSGSIRVCGTEVVGAPASALRKLRGLRAGFIAQDPFSACDPLSNLYHHVAEAWRAHGLPLPLKQIINQVESLGIADATNRLRQYPHEWSGGMLQRAGVAAAAAHHPSLLIADEPTSALDADHAPTVLELLRSFNASLLLISHDLNLVTKHSDRIAVCLEGRIIESGSTSEILQRPQHPYTTKLLAASPSSQPGVFAPISDKADVVVEAIGIGKAYGQNGNSIHAVRRVDLRVRRGEIVGICGPSGCGKSTLLRILATIETPTEGSIFLGGELATSARTNRLLSYNARNGFVMPIFQDPVSSLDRRWPIWRTVTEALMAKHRPEKPSREHRQSISLDFLRRVGLDAIAPEVRPGELSVGQCQRVAIARALVAEPKLIVADEPTSALDAVNAASVLRLLKQAADSGMGIVIVSHDRTLLDALCNRVLEMRDGIILD